MAELPGKKKQGGMSKTKVVVGAAGLLLFILGVRRTFRADTDLAGGADDAPEGRGNGHDEEYADDRHDGRRHDEDDDDEREG